MRQTSLTLAAWLLTGSIAASPALAGGGLVGNGGDSVHCRQTGANSKFPYTGFYVLDYALRFPHPPDLLVRVDSLTASMDRIEQLLLAKAPAALASFRSFRAALNPAPFATTNERWWRAANQGLRDIRDELARKLPPNCRTPAMRRLRDGFRIHYQQTVVRQKTADGRVVYHYDPEIVDAYLAQDDATQASVLLVHEWLWDFYDMNNQGAPRIRSANAYLHSPAAETDAAPEFRQRLFFAQPGS